MSTISLPTREACQRQAVQFSTILPFSSISVSLFHSSFHSTFLRSINKLVAFNEEKQLAKHLLHPFHRRQEFACVRGVFP